PREQTRRLEHGPLGSDDRRCTFTGRVANQLYAAAELEHLIGERRRGMSGADPRRDLLVLAELDAHVIEPERAAARQLLCVSGMDPNANAPGLVGAQEPSVPYVIRRQRAVERAIARVRGRRRPAPIPCAGRGRGAQAYER